MTKKQRDLLRRLMVVTNDMGGSLDNTSTSIRKYIERQESLMKVSNVIYYGIFLDDAKNENRINDLAEAERLISELEILSKKTYPDRQGYLNPY